MHQSPRKEFGGPRREKYTALKLLDEEEAERRALRAGPPKARKFQLRDEAPGRERSRPHPRG